MNGQYISGGMYVPLFRKTKSLFNWLARVTGTDACWIEGTDGHNQPIWGLAKRLSQTCLYVISRKFKTVGVIAALGGVLLFPAQSLRAQTGIDFDKLTGTNGFTLEGVNRNEKSGRAVASGDINGDTYSDLIIGASGKTYVVFGQGSFASTLELGSLDGNTGFLLSGGGEAVASGDINGDGKDDMIIGDGGRTYVVFGQDSFVSTLELSSLDGSTGFVLLGSREAVASGDINGDGKDDVIIGAPTAGRGFQPGETYVVFGFDNTAIDTLELSSLDGSTGFKLHGVDSGDRSGWAVSSGDINGDTYDDVIIGAFQADPNGNNNAGETYVVFGKATTFTSTVELSSLDGSTGFVLNGIISEDISGRAVSSGDINGDTYDDVIIGAFQADPNGIINAGETYVVFGFNDTATDTVELSSLDGSTGFIIKGAKQGDISGDAVSSGDINSDGYVDVIIGGELGNSLRGKSYVVFGFDDKAIGTVELSSLDGSTGFALNGVLDFGRSGIAVGSGDINGDGADDVIIGGDTALEGRTYVFTQFPAAAMLTGQEDFRMLAAPASGTILDEFLEPLWTQGMTGADTPNGDPNLLLWDENADPEGSWNAVSDLASQQITRGQGFLMYVYSDDDFNGTAEGFPKMLNTINIFNSAVVDTGTVTPVDDLGEGRFFLVGNPYPSTFDWDSASVVKTNLSNTIYIYDNANAVWKTWNGTLGAGGITEGRIAPFQSFFIQALNGTGALSIGEGAQTDSPGTFFKQLPVREPRILSIRAEAGDTKAEAWLSFQEGGLLGRDIYDGLFLQPFASEFLKLGTLLASEEILQINALPVDWQEQLVILLDLSGTVEATHAMLTFHGLEAFEGWVLSLRDTHTGEEFPIGSNTSLALDIEPIRAKLPQSLQPMPVPMKAKAAGTRYRIIVTPAASVSNEPLGDVPRVVELQQNYPNPFNPSTTIEFGVPSRGHVRLEVFDMLGRKVAELLNEPMQAGRYTVQFNASALSSGMYIYRLQTGNTSLTQKMMLIK